MIHRARYLGYFTGLASKLLLSCQNDEKPGKGSLNTGGKNFSQRTPPSPEGMVFIPAASYKMGGVSQQAGADEYPRHAVQVDTFFMDETEVTNRAFERFVDETDDRKRMGMCKDKYNASQYQAHASQGKVTNPLADEVYNDRRQPQNPSHVIRGGSFLCNDSYCSGYRVSRRMSSSRDSGFNHTGFRCVKDID